MIRFAIPIYIAAVSASCGPLDDYLATDHEYTASEARDRILALNHKDASALPPTATNFYLFDGGNFSGVIRYWAFDCETREECLIALENLTGVSEADMMPWRASKFAVAMHGPTFYFPELKADAWQVQEISNGLMFERVEGTRQMYYYAIDLDRLRVYAHRESGGFPPDEYDPYVKHRP